MSSRSIGRSRRTPPRCECGCTYAEFNTGITFADAKRMLWDQPDPNRPGWFRQKHRRSVLGFMRELKLMFWDSTHGACTQLAEAA